jgi:glycine/D-amino acid oxidase-like deaminating enzyme
MTNPYIGYMADGLLLVGGGNGFGANGSDEIGRIGARLATRNEWTSEIPESDLVPIL